LPAISRRARLTLLLLAAAGPCVAADGPGPEAVIERAIEVFSNAARDYRRQPSDDAFTAVAAAFLDEYADIEFAAGIIMGEFAREAAPEQKRQMAAALRSRVLDGVAAAVLDIDFNGLVLEPFPGVDDDYPVFVTVTVPGHAGSRSEFRFRMTQRLHDWRIIDVSAGGRSYVTTKRTEFRIDVINYGLDRAIERLAPRADR